MMNLRGLAKWKLIIMAACAASAVCVACAIAALVFSVMLADKTSTSAITSTAKVRSALIAAQTETAGPTVTPMPTDLPTVAVPTNTHEPTAMPTEPPMLTNTPAPAATATRSAATSTDLPTARIVIMTVNKRDEYVDIQNSGDAAQDLAGWVLISEEGNQQCPLLGVLQPGVTLRIWALASDRDQGGFNCGFDGNIWNNDDPDAAVLVDATGREVSRK